MSGVLWGFVGFCRVLFFTFVILTLGLWGRGWGSAGGAGDRLERGGAGEGLRGAGKGLERAWTRAGEERGLEWRGAGEGLERGWRGERVEAGGASWRGGALGLVSGLRGGLAEGFG